MSLKVVHDFTSVIYTVVISSRWNLQNSCRLITVHNSAVLQELASCIVYKNCQVYWTCIWLVLTSGESHDCHGNITFIVRYCALQTSTWNSSYCKTLLATCATWNPLSIYEDPCATGTGAWPLFSSPPEIATSILRGWEPLVSNLGTMTVRTPSASSAVTRSRSAFCGSLNLR